MESKNHKYEYGCVMLFYSLPELSSIHQKIDPFDIYVDTDDSTYGLEKEPHTTLLFGFHNTVDGTEVLDICSSILKNELDSRNLILKLTNVSLFTSEKYDVLKFEVDNPILHKINSFLKQYYYSEYTNDFPNYHPHCTIAYIKKGKGQHYVDLFNNISAEVIADSLVYSMPGGEKISLSI